MVSSTYGATMVFATDTDTGGRRRQFARSSDGAPDATSALTSPEEQQTDRPDIDWATIAFAGKLLSARNQMSRKFKRLVSEWRERRNQFSSDPAVLAMSPPYQKIIAMGPEVIPFILKEMQRSPDHWFWALQMLADTDAVKKPHRGIMSEMTKDWLEWGKKNGFVLRTYPRTPAVRKATIAN